MNWYTVKTQRKTKKRRHHQWMMFRAQYSGIAAENALNSKGCAFPAQKRMPFAAEATFIKQANQATRLMQNAITVMAVATVFHRTSPEYAVCCLP